MVGRRETPIDPRAPYANFACGLRALKIKSNKSHRQIEADAHYCAPTLCEAASGKSLPTLEVTLAFVGACGGNTTEWTYHWKVEEQKGQVRRRQR